MTLTHSRNVGIGTTNPTTNLDVCGNTLLRNDLTVNGSTIFNVDDDEQIILRFIRR